MLIFTAIAICFYDWADFHRVDFVSCLRGVVWIIVAQPNIEPMFLHKFHQFLSICSKVIRLHKIGCGNCDTVKLSPWRHSDFTMTQTLHGKGSTGCENSDSTSHSIISSFGLVIFVYINRILTKLYRRGALNYGTPCTLGKFHYWMVWAHTTITNFCTILHKYCNVGHKAAKRSTSTHKTDSLKNDKIKKKTTMHRAHKNC